MEENKQAVFFRQPQSKAIPIIKPDSGERLSVVTAPRLSATRDLHAQVRPHTPIHAKSPVNIKPDPDLAYETPGQSFSVYASPFVPEALRIINTLEGENIVTPAVSQVDFAAYVGSSVGLAFLPHIPEPITGPGHPIFSLTDDIIHSHYEKYFRGHLEAEIQSQQRENESYALYGHEVRIISQEPGQTTCSFLVPGLRENSPYVEEDDPIQLRQLRYDHLGRPLGMEQWLTPVSQSSDGPPGFPVRWGPWRGEQAPGWTGIVYNARASHVQRKQEQLLVRVVGLTPPNLEFNIHYLQPGVKFNIQFPVPTGRYLPMQHVLPIIQMGLSQTDCCQSSYLGTPGAADVAHSVSYTASRNDWLKSMLFPDQANCKVQTNLNTASFNRPFVDGQLNWEQQKAIESICSHNYGIVPFLISGPPGTGKTKTLVETALQLVNNVDGASHILFCAPSDPAADTLVQRLSGHFNPDQLLRLNRPSRTFAEVSGHVLPFCYVSHNLFCIPPFKKLMSHNIVVTTCRDACLLMYSRVTNSDLYAAEYGLLSSIHPQDAPPWQATLHWTALLIDEAAQAIEPEALIPLAVVAPPLESPKLAFTPLFVMAGDEHQLGPRTSLASSPLKTSLFARLFSRPVYADHPLARGKSGKAPRPLNRAMLPIPRPAFANLIRNYRSHPAILAVPSALFYADTLEPEAAGTDRLHAWPGWSGRRWPVLFHDNVSEDELEMDGGGWYNAGEAHVACRYAASLVQAGLVAQSEVCIMSPFKAQVQRLRKTIRDPQYGSLWDVDIGPTEIFQGLERAVVILCTTRSKQRFLNKDKELDWGIIGTPNKMNVALTRAKFGLIVIGKRELLRDDPNWKTFLDFCERNGLVAGHTNRPGWTHSGEPVKLARLEKVLLARENDLGSLQGSRSLNGVNQDDEMWTSGMQAALDTDSVSGDMQAALDIDCVSGYRYDE